MMDSAAMHWREALLDTLGRFPDVPLLLSGGMDSVTLLAGLTVLGERPLCLTFALEGEESPDVVAAREVAAYAGVPLSISWIRRSTLRENAREAVRVGGTARKTAVQCVAGILPLLRRLRDGGYQEALIGTGGVCEDNRRAQVLSADRSPGVRDELDALRRRNLYALDEGSATRVMSRVGAERGISLFEPFALQPIAEVGLRMSWEQMNTPRQKGIALRAFPEFFGDPGCPRFWRRNASLQVAGGIREWHDNLLSMPDMNPDGKWKRVQGVYGRLLEQERGERLAI